MQPFFLVDCNNFYVSCERVFNPALRAQPVVVLSSNDACVIARSQEAKALGIPMGAAAWEYEREFKLHNVHVYSANFALYGDMSSRVMHALTELATDIEIYSVDEAFLRVAPTASYESSARMMQQEVQRRTGIPISIGIGATKTLAKIANHLAKKNPEYNGVCDLTTAADVDTLLARVPVEDVWGVGYRYAKKLVAKGIRTARDLKRCDDAWVRKNFTIMGLKTVHELRGIVCSGLQVVPEAKQSITVSRMFGEKTTKHESAYQAVAAYISSAAQKLRTQRSLTGHVTVFVLVAPYDEAKNYYQSTQCALSVPTAYTPALIKAAHSCLDKLLMEGLRYKKVGVILSDLVPADGVQLNMYAPEPDLVKQAKLMQAMDRINAKVGKNKLFFAAAGIKQQWKMKQTRKSACFTTSWHELLTVRV